MKRLSNLIYLSLALALGAIGSCTTVNIAGATSETTNGDIKAQVTFSDGTPAAFARVQLVDDAGWLAKMIAGSSVVVESTLTDGNGRCLVHVPRHNRCNLQIDRMQVDGRSEGLFVHDINSLLDTTGAVSNHDFQLNSYGAVKGKVLAVTGTLLDLHLSGSTYRTQINAGGDFSFDAVAAGSYALIARVNINGTIQQDLIQSINVVSDSVLSLADQQTTIARLLVDDFTLGYGQTDLGRALGDGLWYTATDKVDKGNSTVTPVAVSDSQAYDGSSLRVKYVMGNKVADPWAVAGIDIGTSLQGTVYDFSAVKAISFWAKGRGSVNVTFLSQTIRALYADSAQFYYPLHLPATWTHIVIPVDSLRLPDNAPPALKSYTWQQVAAEMQTIDFNVENPYTAPGDSVELWLDEIYLEGVTLDSLTR